MGNKYDVSLIIPTWNVMRKTIGENLAVDFGLKTICNQFVEGFSLEVIFVDDFSTDNTVEHISKWISNHPEVDAKIIPMQERGYGPGPGRNFGMSHAQGEFIAFMDNDDQLGEGSVLYDLFKKAKKWGSDLIIGKAEKKGKGSLAKSLFEQGDFERVDFYKINPLASIAVWSRLYKREFLQGIQAHFPEKNGGVQEDFYFNAQIFANTNKISLLADKVYYYWVDTDVEHLSSEWLANSFDKICEQHLECLRVLIGSKETYKWQHTAAMLERIMNTGAFNALYKNFASRELFILKSENHFKLIALLNEGGIIEKILPYLPVEKQYQLLAINGTESFTDAAERLAAVRISFNPTIFSKTNQLYQTLSEQMIFEYKLWKENKGKIIEKHVELDTQDGLLVKTNELITEDDVVAIVNRERTSFEVFPLNSKINLNRNLTISGATYDIFVARQTYLGLVGEMAQVKGEWKTLTIPVGMGKSIKIYKNWKGGLSYNVQTVK